MDAGLLKKCLENRLNNHADHIILTYQWWSIDNSTNADACPYFPECKHFRLSYPCDMSSACKLTKKDSSSKNNELISIAMTCYLQTFIFLIYNIVEFAKNRRELKN